MSVASARCDGCGHCYPLEQLRCRLQGNKRKQYATLWCALCDDDFATWETSPEHDALQGALPLDGTTSQGALL